MIYLRYTLCRARKMKIDFAIVLLPRCTDYEEQKNGHINILGL